MSDYGDIDFDFDECVQKPTELTEEEKQAQQKQHEEWKRRAVEREKQEKAFSDSLRTDKAKKQVKWLSNIIDNEGCELDDFLLDGFDDKYDALDFLQDLIKVGAVKKNIMMALMDKKGLFDSIYEGIKEAEADAHEEWWYGQARDEGFW